MTTKTSKPRVHPCLRCGQDITSEPEAGQVPSFTQIEIECVSCQFEREALLLDNASEADALAYWLRTAIGQPLSPCMVFGLLLAQSLESGLPQRAETAYRHMTILGWLNDADTEGSEEAMKDFACMRIYEQDRSADDRIVFTVKNGLGNDPDRWHDVWVTVAGHSAIVESTRWPGATCQMARFLLGAWGIGSAAGNTVSTSPDACAPLEPFGSN